MMCEKPVKVGKDQSIPKISTVGPRPPAGNQPKLTANVSININPTQNEGTEKPNTDAPIINFANHFKT